VIERPYAEVAAMLGCTETAARLRVMGALGKLSRFIPSQQSSAVE
jgi:DNA-directed RNA polymerase specialized sigma24 family protein